MEELRNAKVSPSAVEGLSRRWLWFTVLGVVLLIIGFIAALSLPFATVAATYYVGIMMTIGGILQLVHAFAVKKIGRFLVWFIAGILYTIAGIICFYEPLFAALVFTLLLGISLLASGLVRLFIGIDNRKRSNWGWIIASGVVTALLGVLVISGWPANTLWILGLFLAIDLMFQGWSMVAFGLGLRQFASN